jgi:hypothetical protein
MMKSANIFPQMRKPILNGFAPDAFPNFHLFYPLLSPTAKGKSVFPHLFKRIGNASLGNGMFIEIFKIHAQFMYTVL